MVDCGSLKFIVEFAFAKRTRSVRPHSALHIVKTELSNTVASYFAPVKVVINEVSRAITAESTPPTRPGGKL